MLSRNYTNLMEKRDEQTALDVMYECNKLTSVIRSSWKDLKFKKMKIAWLNESRCALICEQADTLTVIKRPSALRCCLCKIE